MNGKDLVMQRQQKTILLAVVIALLMSLVVDRHGWCLRWGYDRRLRVMSKSGWERPMSNSALDSSAIVAQ